MRKIIRYQIFFSYGIWSKYNPLSITAQNGLYGLLDSNYYQLHNAIEFEQQNLNLIYYDFIDYGQQSIIKTIQFVDNENIQWKFEKSIDEFQYENIWYFLQIYAWPQLRTLELIIAQNQNIVFRKQLEIQYPFHDNNLILTFGGSFKVIKSQIADIALGTIFSTFPGQIILQEFSNEYIQLPLDPSIFIDEAFQTFNVCICQVSEEQQKIVDKDLQHLDQNSYIPEYVNCDSFILQGWFKIIKIVSIDQEFTYQIVRLGSNKDNQIFQNGNLAAFQLFYMISNDQYKIIFTTYSYRFPFINIDFKNNPFLIQKEYTFAQDLVNVWQYLFVKLKSNLLQVSMNIFLNDQNFIINDEIEVTQFKNVQFKLHYGNIEQNNNNYLNLQVRNLMLYNCDQNINKFGCHFSCQECDGPSNSNCLSCKEHSLRVYLSEFKVCIFPYFSIDQNEVCVTDKNQKIEIIEFKDDESNLQCKQGFFEYDGECFNCPSVIRENLISCYDCYKNPKGWSQNSFCFNEIYLQDSGNLDDVIHGTDGFYYQFDGIDLNYCYSYWQINGIQDEIAIDYLFSQLNLGFLDFCQAQENIKSNCYICNIYSCQDCYITLQGMQCIRCNQGWEFVDGVCTFSNLINPYPKGENYDDCLPPYYITSKQQCILCPILNCLYCFEYLDNFLTQNSFKPNHLFMYQEDIKIGCAMCKENYVYDFTLEKCIFQNTQIPNCLRSFIDHDGQELCTLSSINFLNSPEIYDCQNYISNCKQCLKYPSNIICVVCQTGYVVEYEQCFQNEELISTSYQIQRWRIQVESFRIQFAPSFNDIDDQIVILVNQCEPDCQICQFNDISQCQQCSLNYFKQRMRVEKGQKCSDCPQLCQLCTSRSTEDIYSLQPQFEIDDSNLIYTKQCLKPYFDKYIIFNPYSKITRYCINQLCNYYVKIDRIIKLCISQRFNYFDYRDYMDIDYLNQLGIDYIVLQSQLQVYEQDCYGPTQILAYHSLKKKLFTLRKIKIILYSLNTLFFHGPSSFDFIYFDSILIDNIGFVFEYFSMGKFRFQNENKRVDITLNNVMIKDSYINNSDSVINTLIFGNIDFTNVTIMNTKIYSSSFLNLTLGDFIGQIIIDTMTFSDSIILDSQLFKFSKNQFTILIKNIHIENCDFINSRFFYFTTNNVNDTDFIFQNIIIKSSRFINSLFLDCSSRMNLKINNFSLINNNLTQSIIIGFSYNLQLFQISVIQNIFVDSQFLSTMQMLYQVQKYCKVNYFKGKHNQFQNSNLILIFSTYQMSSLILEMTDIILEENSNYLNNNSNQSIHLFNINCYQIFIQNVQITNSNNIHVLYHAKFLFPFQKCSIFKFFLFYQITQFCFDIQ